jgi:hypothetical protein
MRNDQLRRFVRAAVLALVPVALATQAGSVAARDAEQQGFHNEHRRHSHHWWRRHHRSKVIRGITVTGVNDVRGQPAFSWGPPYGTFGFPTLGVRNENGPEPLPIDSSTPDSAVLATYIDPEFLVVSGARPEDVKPEWVNVPLFDVPINVDFNFVQYAPLPSVLNSTPIRPAQVEPGTNPITMGKWMDASGIAKISCKGDRATVKLRLRDLIPRRMYTVWATLGLPSDGSAETFFPIPLGGVPNILMSELDGSGEYEREIKFCPLKPRSTLRPLLTINVQFHATAQNFGGVPEPGFLPGWWQGVITFNQVVFPVNAEPLRR